MEKFYCNLNERQVTKNSCPLNQNPIQLIRSRTCKQCSLYDEILASKVAISSEPKFIPGKPCIAITQKTKSSRIDTVWACIRRNEEFRAFCKENKGKKIDEDISLWADWISKWGIDGEVPNPDDPTTPSNLELMEEPLPIAYYSTYASGKHRDMVKIIPPGTILINRETKKEVKVKEWLLYDYKDKIHIGITRENCPHFLKMQVYVRTTFKKSEVKKLLMEKFDEGYDILIRAQKRMLKTKETRPRYDQIETYMQIYELKKYKHMSLPEIALKKFPGQTTALENVRTYWKKAKDLVEKGGWRQL